MKEVLIYGALFAAVIGASIPVLNNVIGGLNGSSDQVQQSVQAQTTALNDFLANNVNSNSGGNQQGGAN